MKKQDLVDRIVNKAGLSSRESHETVDLLFDLLKMTLERGEEIKITGFGSFQVRDKAARTGRNPHTGETITLRARKVLAFRPSRRLRELINGASAAQWLNEDES